MPSYQFLVNALNDQFCIDAAITASSPEEALAKLKDLLPRDINLTPDQGGPGGYAQILINPDYVSLQHICRVDDDDVDVTNAP